MTYQQWLDTLVSPIQYFLNWLISIANSLIHNYFFITFLGITIFISLVWLIFNLIFDTIDSINSRYDDYNDKNYNYELLKEVQSDYLNNHYTDEYDYRYRSKVLNGQVLNSYLQLNKELDTDNRRLANLNKIEALKEIKQDILSDDDPSNDDDIDLIIPPKPQLAKKEELDNNWIHDYYEEVKQRNNDKIDKILYDNGYIDNNGKLELINSDNVKCINGYMVNAYTGEVLNDFPEPVPVGPIEDSNMTDEQKKEIKDFNDKHFLFPKYNHGLIDDEKLESELFL